MRIATGKKWGKDNWEMFGVVLSLLFYIKKRKLRSLRSNDLQSKLLLTSYYDYSNFLSLKKVRLPDIFYIIKILPAN